MTERQPRLLGLLGLAVAACLLAGAGVVVALAREGVSVGTEPAAAAIATAPSTTTTEPGPSLSDAELVQQYGDAVWRVEVDGCGFTGTGSAFAIAPDLLVTNHHVVTVDTTPVLRSRAGRPIAGEVVGMSETPDIALIRVAEPLTTTLTWADPAALSEGDHLLGLGYPVPARDFTATAGSILSFQATAGTLEGIRTDGALEKGNSGGPAVNERGEVIGVITRKLRVGGVQDAALLLSRDAVGSALAAWSAATDVVAPDCVTAPPPAPEDVDTPAEPTEAPPPLEVPAVPVPAVVLPVPAPCPTGRVTAAVTHIDAAALDPELTPGLQDVTVHGTVTNHTSADVSVLWIEVVLDGTPTRATGFIQELQIHPGRSAAFEASLTDVLSGPPSVHAVELEWDWSQYQHVDCPSA
jgi:S1-C subfamily serine protease